MRSVVAPLFAALPFFTACVALAHSGVKGNGEKATQVRRLEGFQRVELHTSMDVDVKEGSAYTVSVTTDANLQPLIITEVKNGRLIIRADREVQPSRYSRVEVTLPDFRGASIIGSGDLSISGVSQPKPLALDMSGSGNLRFTGAAQRLALSLSGSGDARIELTGQVEEVRTSVSGSGNLVLRGGPTGTLDVSINGSSDMNARGLPARSATFRISGSGDVSTTLTGGELRAEISGSGDINWWGQAQVKVSTSGSGDVIHHD